MAKSTILLALVICLCSAVGCDSEVDPDSPPGAADCSALHEHVLDLRLSATRRTAMAVATEKLGDGRHRVNLRKSSQQAFLKNCRQKRSRAYVSCALASDDMTSLRECRDL